MDLQELSFQLLQFCGALEHQTSYPPGPGNQGCLLSELLMSVGLVWQLESVGSRHAHQLLKGSRKMSWLCVPVGFQQCNWRVPCLCGRLTFRLGVRECHNHLCLPALSRGQRRVATGHTSWPQWVPWPFTPAHPSKVAGRCHVQACLSVLAGYVESTQQHLPVTPSPGSISTVPCPSSWYSQVSKWSSLT